MPPGPIGEFVDEFTFDQTLAPRVIERHRCPVHGDLVPESVRPHARKPEHDEFRASDRDVVVPGPVPGVDVTKKVDLGQPLTNRIAAINGNVRRELGEPPEAPTAGGGLSPQETIPPRVENPEHEVLFGRPWHDFVPDDARSHPVDLGLCVQGSALMAIRNQVTHLVTGRQSTLTTKEFEKIVGHHGAPLSTSRKAPMCEWPETIGLSMTVRTAADKNSRSGHQIGAPCHRSSDQNNGRVDLVHAERAHTTDVVTRSVLEGQWERVRMPATWPESVKVTPSACRRRRCSRS